VRDVDSIFRAQHLPSPTEQKQGWAHYRNSRTLSRPILHFPTDGRAPPLNPEGVKLVSLLECHSCNCYDKQIPKLDLFYYINLTDILLTPLPWDIINRTGVQAHTCTCDDFARQWIWLHGYLTYWLDKIQALPNGGYARRRISYSTRRSYGTPADHWLASGLWPIRIEIR
jgi:hypothetical protein